MKLQKGDVVLCQVPMPSSQLQQFKLRPAVIVSANDINQILDDVMVVPCTSNRNRSFSINQQLESLGVKLIRSTQKQNYP